MDQGEVDLLYLEIVEIDLSLFSFNLNPLPRHPVEGFPIDFNRRKHGRGLKDPT